MLYRIILCSKTLCLNRKILHSVKVCTYCIHKDLCILKLRKCICNILVDQASCGDHSQTGFCCTAFLRIISRRNCLCRNNSKFIRPLFLFGLCYCVSIFRCLHKCTCCYRISCRICQCHSMCIRQKHHLRTDSVRKITGYIQLWEDIIWLVLITSCRIRNITICTFNSIHLQHACQIWEIRQRGIPKQTHHFSACCQIICQKCHFIF